MIDAVSSVSTPPPTGASAPAPASADAGKASVFATTLGALTLAPVSPDVLYDGPTDKSAPPPAEAIPYRDVVLLDLPGKRQRLAGGGKDLPGDAAPVDPSDGDVSKDVLWLPIAFALPVLAPMSAPSLPAPGRAMPVTAENSSAPPPPPTSPINASPAQAGAQSGDVSAPAIASPHWAPASAGEALEGGEASKGREAPEGGIAAIANDGRTVSAKIVIDAKPAMPAATDIAGPITSPPAPLTQPAGQAFAAAIAVAVQSRRDEREPADDRTPVALAATTLEALHKPAIAATADAKHPALDLRQDSGLQGMIDRIETLRDDADARDTRIRLVPDALGAVDVAVRKDGERVHVHFNTEAAASARLLIEAQPRLADLAEARGLKLGQATVGSGVDHGAGDARRHRPDAILPTAPAAIRAPETSDITDTRIA